MKRALREKKRIHWAWFVIPAAVLVLVCAAAAAAVLLTGKVQVVPAGPEEITLEYGETFTDPGAAATWELPWWGARPLEVQVAGAVDTSRLGEYVLEYSAAFLRDEGAARRVVRVVDTKPPVLTLEYVEGHLTMPGQPYEEEGYRATDQVDGDITDRVTAQERDGFVYYSVADGSGNTAEAVREIVYGDATPPELTLLGEETMELPAGTAYEEPGYTALDDRDGDLTAAVAVSGEVDCYRSGEYELTYRVADSSGNETVVVRRVTVVPTPQPGPMQPGDKVVYLTFDDGPSRYTKDLLDLLDKYNVKATFFVVNMGYQDMIGEAFRRGHSIGVHSASHDYRAIYASEEAYFEDFEKMMAIVEKQTGQRTTLMRFPGGSSNTVSRFNPGIMTRLVRAVTDMGYQYFDWNVSSGDAGATTKTEVVLQNVINGIKNHNVSVVLQHDSLGYSMAAVEDIIVWGLENGYTFLPLTPESPTAHHGLAN